MAPPEKVFALALVILIVPVDALTVKLFTFVLAFQLVPSTVHTPLPSVRVFVPEPSAKVPIVTLRLLAFSVPFVRVSARVAPMVNAS